MLNKEKERKKKMMIPQEELESPEFVEFTREIKNPALGQTYLEKKYGKLYENYYVNILMNRI